MIENKTKVNSSEVLAIRPANRSFAHQDVLDDREFSEQLDLLAPWLKVIRLLRGPLFWVSLAAITASLFAVALLSFLGWVPGPMGRVVMAVGMVFFWAAMMTAFAGWILRSEN